MNHIKDVVLAICICTLLAQSVQPARAQAQSLAPLVQLGLQVASAVVPLIIPVVVTVTVAGVQKACMVGAYVKERMPRLRRDKGQGSETQEYVSAGSDGESITPGSEEGADSKRAIAEVRGTVRIGGGHEAESAGSPSHGAAEYPVDGAEHAGSQANQHQTSHRRARAANREADHVAPPKEGPDWYID